MRVGVMVAVAGALLSTAAQAAETPSGSVERGRKIYLHQMCHNCHGTVGQGGGVAGPRIAPKPIAWETFAQLVRKPRLVMVPYSEKNLPEQDLADIYAYIVSIKPGPAAKDIPLLNF